MPRKSSIKTRLSQVILDGHSRFLAYLTGRVQSREAAEEILHSAYVKGLKKSGTLQDSEKLTAWFFRLLKNSLTDHYRHHAAEKRALEGFGAESEREQRRKDAELEKNVCQCVNRVMKDLKPEYADVIRKAEIEDRSIKDLAAKAKTTPTNMSVRLLRARASLKKKVLQTCGACANHGCLNCTCKHPV